MSLIFSAKQLQSDIDHVIQEATKQQLIYHKLISELVKLNQQYRLDKQYAIADDIRSLLNSVGIEVKNGSMGMPYSEIQDKNTLISDTWKRKA